MANRLHLASLLLLLIYGRSGDAIRCYQCLDCASPSDSFDCDIHRQSFDVCATAHIGNSIMRGCYTSKGLEDSVNGCVTEGSTITCYCNTTDNCNNQQYLCPATDQPTNPPTTAPTSTLQPLSGRGALPFNADWLGNSQTSGIKCYRCRDCAEPSGELFDCGRLTSWCKTVVIDGTVNRGCDLVPFGDASEGCIINGEVSHCRCQGEGCNNETLPVHRTQDNITTLASITELVTSSPPAVSAVPETQPGAGPLCIAIDRPLTTESPSEEVPPGSYMCYKCVDCMEPMEGYLFDCQLESTEYTLGDMCSTTFSTSGQIDRGCWVEDGRGEGCVADSDGDGTLCLCRGDSCNNITSPNFSNPPTTTETGTSTLPAYTTEKTTSTSSRSITTHWQQPSTTKLTEGDRPEGPYMCYRCVDCAEPTEGSLYDCLLDSSDYLLWDMCSTTLSPSGQVDRGCMVTPRDGRGEGCVADSNGGGTLCLCRGDRCNNITSPNFVNPPTTIETGTATLPALTTEKTTSISPASWQQLSTTKLTGDDQPEGPYMCYRCVDCAEPMESSLYDCQLDSSDYLLWDMCSTTLSPSGQVDRGCMVTPRDGRGEGCVADSNGGGTLCLCRGDACNSLMLSEIQVAISCYSCTDCAKRSASMTDCELGSICATKINLDGTVDRGCLATDKPGHPCDSHSSLTGKTCTCFSSGCNSEAYFANKRGEVRLGVGEGNSAAGVVESYRSILAVCLALTALLANIHRL